jgi:hypothetical protein
MTRRPLVRGEVVIPPEAKSALEQWRERRDADDIYMPSIGSYEGVEYYTGEFYGDR